MLVQRGLCKEATFAIDYAIAASEEAEVAVSNATVTRTEAKTPRQRNLRARGEATAWRSSWLVLFETAHSHG